MSLLLKAVLAPSLEEAINPIIDALELGHVDRSAMFAGGLPWSEMSMEGRQELIGDWLCFETRYSEPAERVAALDNLPTERGN